MDVNEAVMHAKQHVLQLFATEGVENIGLEEVEFNDVNSTWSITIGFSRPWDQPQSTAFAAISGRLLYPKRTYKVVRISDADAKVISVKNREVESCAIED